MFRRYALLATAGIVATAITYYILSPNRRHLFWETQPVPDSQTNEGQIAVPTTVATNTELPVDYTWGTPSIAELATFINAHYSRGEIYTKSFLANLNLTVVGVYHNRSLIGTITYRSVGPTIDGEFKRAYYVDYLCIHPEYRNNRLAPIIISKVVEAWKEIGHDLCIFKKDDGELPFNKLASYYYYHADLHDHDAAKLQYTWKSASQSQLAEILPDLDGPADQDNYRVFLEPDTDWIWDAYVAYDGDNVAVAASLLVPMKSKLSDGTEVQMADLIHHFGDPDAMRDLPTFYKLQGYDFFTTLGHPTRIDLIRGGGFVKNHRTNYYFYNYKVQCKPEEVYMMFV